jgi:drug/metabolite transporter (DMT)-like permease
VACWVPWTFVSKLGSEQIPATTMQYLFNWGSIPVGLGFLMKQRFRIEKSPKGIAFGLTVGILSAIGQLALFAAFRYSSNASVVTVLTSLYPLVTVVLAVIVLHERLTKAQVLGLGFAAAAFVIFSF